MKISLNRFLVLGRAGLDLYADPPGTPLEDAGCFRAALGGSAANIAAGITRLGGAASLITAVSDDAVGRYTIKQLQHYGIGTEHLLVTGGEARNSLAVVETRNENCQSVIYRNGAADFQLAVSAIEGIQFAEFGALIVTGTALAVEPSRSACFRAIARAKQEGRPVILDVDYRPYSWRNSEQAADTCIRAASMCEIVIGNDAEFAMMSNGGDGLALARNLGEENAKIVVYKMGANGSIAFSHGRSTTTGIFQVSALKPTGAGDAFMAGFVTSLSTGADVARGVLRGTAAAAIVVTRVGCAPAMPTQTELDEFIAARAVLTQTQGP